MIYGLMTMTRGAMTMSRHYRGHHHHRGGHYHGGGDIISLIIGIIFYIFILIFEVIKACFEWGTARSKAVGFGIIGAVILIWSLIEAGVSGGIIGGLIIFFVILFFILLATMDSPSQSSATSGATNTTSSQRSARQSMLNQYSKDGETDQAYMQDDIHDMNFYHHHFHEKADFDDQFAAMEAQVHHVNYDEDEEDFEGTGYSWNELADMDVDEREGILEEEGVHEDMWDEF